MADARILYKITGSIAAYKSATVISKLVQAGCQVQVITSSSTLNFIGKATLEGLTGKPVYSDTFESGKMMSHIDLVKWADLTVMAPATGNSINKMAAGIADELTGALFLAHDWSKPYLLAPAMNTNMYNHPATKSSIGKLKKWGVNILPTASGYLACGDEGAGKMLEPEEILAAIWTSLESAGKTKSKNGSVILTAGGTREAIDEVRFTGNVSSGRTGAILADHFIRSGYEVHYLHGSQSQIPSLPCRLEEFSDTTDLASRLQDSLKNRRYDAVIHLAAVSDYTPESVSTDDAEYSLPLDKKINSDSRTLTVKFKKTVKLVEKLRSWSANDDLQLVAFKLTANGSEDSVNRAVSSLFKRSDASLIVANDMNQRQNNTQTNFSVYENPGNGDPLTAGSAADLARILEEKIRKDVK